MMKEGELAFAGAHSCSWYACCGGTHAVEQLQQRAEAVGSAPLVVRVWRGGWRASMRNHAGSLPTQHRDVHPKWSFFADYLGSPCAQPVPQFGPLLNCRLMLARSRSRLCYCLHTTLGWAPTACTKHRCEVEHTHRCVVRPLL